MKTKRAVDIVMTVFLLFLMAYQVTEQAAHEWLGMGMAALVILHQILNRKWYAALFRGKYGAIRILQTCVNVLLLLAFAASAVSGMALSEYAVPFLRNLLPPVTARTSPLMTVTLLFCAIDQKDLPPITELFTVPPLTMTAFPSTAPLLL